MSEPIQVGDVVRLTCGTGPTMTVERVDGQGYAVCVYPYVFGSQLMGFSRDTIATAALARVRAGNET